MIQTKSVQLQGQCVQSLLVGPLDMKHDTALQTRAGDLEPSCVVLLLLSVAALQVTH